MLSLYCEMTLDGLTLMNFLKMSPWLASGGTAFIVGAIMIYVLALLGSASLVAVCVCLFVKRKCSPALLWLGLLMVMGGIGVGYPSHWGIGLPFMVIGGWCVVRWNSKG